MDNLKNPLLKMFMKSDKKEVSPTPGENETENQKKIENQNEIEKNNSIENKFQNNSNQSKEKTQKNQKNKEKSTQKKKKKVLQDTLPDLISLEPPIQKQQKALDFKYLVPKNVFLLDDFKANADWEANLINWFARLRPRINQMVSGDEISLEKVIALIQKGEMPKSNEASFECEQILGYFERQDHYTKSDLAWIFSSLIFTDRLLNGAIVECLSNILTSIINQINSLQTKEDVLYPYLMTDATILQRFFHLES